MVDDLKKLRSNFYRLILRAKPYRRRRSLFAGGALAKRGKMITFRLSVSIADIGKFRFQMKTKLLKMKV